MAENDEIPQGDRPPVKTILVVEDDIDIGDFIVEVIQQETPYQALAATNGYPRSQTPEQYHASSARHRLSDACHEWLELYERLLHMEAFQHVPVLFMSANAPAKEFQKRHLPSIAKPFEIEHFLEMLQDIMKEDD